MVCTFSSSGSSMDCLSGKMQALERQVSEIPSRFELLEQRTDLLEKIFLFVDIDVLNKAIAATTAHRCGPPVLVPSCQASSYTGGGSLMNSTCGFVPKRASREPMSPEPHDSARGVAHSSQAADVVAQVAQLPTSARARAHPPISALLASSAGDSHWSAPWPTPVPSPRHTSADDSEPPMSLISAAEAGRADVVATLLGSRADHDARSTDNETALHRAAYWSKKDVVELLLSARADPSARDRKGKTPMRKSYDNPDIVSALLQARADPNAVDEGGRTTMHRSAENGHLDVIDVLVRAGADPNIGNTEEETALHEAANFGQVGALQAILRAKGDVNAQDAYGATPLHFATYGGHVSIAKLLLESKADVLRVNNDGETPLKSAEHNKKSVVADILRTAELLVKSHGDILEKDGGSSTSSTEQTEKTDMPDVLFVAEPIAEISADVSTEVEDGNIPLKN